MVTQHQYLIFEAEFISLLNRFVAFLENKNYKVTFNPTSLDGDDCSITASSIYYSLYKEIPFVKNHFPHDVFNFGEIFDSHDKEEYRPSPLLDCEIVGNSNVPLSIYVQVYLESDNQTHTIYLVLNRSFKSEQVYYNFDDWRSMMVKLVDHIENKIK